MDNDCVAYARASLAQARAVRLRKKRLQARQRAHQTDGQAFGNVAAPQPKARRPRQSATQQAGSLAEDLAAEYLLKAGLRVVARNLRKRTGEIDLVCLDGGTLVFVEVRQRGTGRFGGAAASVNRHKRQRLMRTAALLLADAARRWTNGKAASCRFDVVTLEPEGINWLRNAFAVE